MESKRNSFFQLFSRSDTKRISDEYLTHSELDIQCCNAYPVKAAILVDLFLQSLFKKILMRLNN